MKIINLILALFISFSCVAQIEVRKKEEQSPFKEIEGKIKNLPYDSLNNNPGINLGGFVGQRLLMNKTNITSHSSKFGQKTYSGFYTNVHSEPQKVYKAVTSEDFLKETNTDIDALYGKYFTYVGYEITKINLSYSNTFNIYLKLTDEKNDTLYFEYLKNVSPYYLSQDTNFPFITEGYYTKSINELKGKKVQRGNALYNCLDVFVEENDDNLTYKLQDVEGKTERYNFSKYSKVTGFKQYKFDYDTSYLAQDKSTFKVITKDKSEGRLNISSQGTAIYINTFFAQNSCFSTDDVMILKLSNDNKIEEYYRGKFNCKGVAYIKIEITIDRHLEWIEKLTNYDLQSVIISSSTSDYVILSPNDYNRFKESLKAHYMNILNK